MLCEPHFDTRGLVIRAVSLFELRSTRLPWVVGPPPPLLLYVPHTRVCAFAWYSPVCVHLCVCEPWPGEYVLSLGIDYSLVCVHLCVFEEDPRTGRNREIVLNTVRDSQGNVEYECVVCSSFDFYGGPTGANCTVPGIELETLQIKPGYFRETNTSRVVRMCPNVNACLGGVVYDKTSNSMTQCIPGQTGKYCDECLAGRYRTGRREDGALCTGNCADIDMTATLVMAGVVAAATLIGVLALLRAAQNHGQALLQWVQDSEHGRDRAGCCRRVLRKTIARSSSAGIKAKIFIAMLQLLECAGTSFSIRYPPFFKAMIRQLISIFMLGFFIRIEFMPLECSVPLNYLTKMVLYTALPLALCVSLTLLSAVLRRFSPTGSKEGSSPPPLLLFLAQKSEAAAFAILYLCWPSAAQYATRFSICDEVSGSGETGGRFLLDDFSVDCDGAEHQALRPYATVMFIVYVVGVPWFLAGLLLRYRHILNALSRSVSREESAKRFSMTLVHEESAGYASEAELRDALFKRLSPAVLRITTGYDLRRYWFELFESFRRIFFIWVVTWFEPGTVEQRTIGLIGTFLLWGALNLYKPYESYSDELLARAAQFNTFFAIITGMITQIVPDSPLVDFALCSIMLASLLIGLMGEIVLDDDCKSFMIKLTTGNIGRFLSVLRTKATRLLDACLRPPTLDTVMKAKLAVAPSSNPLNA